LVVKWLARESLALSSLINPIAIAS
jgi:hypothetical protein